MQNLQQSFKIKKKRRRDIAHVYDIDTLAKRIKECIDEMQWFDTIEDFAEEVIRFKKKN